MRVILSVDALTPPLTGIGRYTWELATRIGNVRDIEQLSYHISGRRVNDPSILLMDKPLRKKRVRLPRWAKDWYWRQACRGQVFHAPNYFLPDYIESGVATLHDLSVLKYPETHPLERVRAFERSFRQTLGIATHLITDSETTRQEVIEYCGWPAERITAIHLGVSSHFFPIPKEQLTATLKRYSLRSDGYSLCVSTIEPRKKIDSMLAAYSRLPEDLRATYPMVLIGGKGWRSENLHKVIDAGQKAGWLRYLGYVAQCDLPELYAGAHLFIYPSSYEGFGLPIAEAMASGVPTVSSDCSCLPEVTAGAAKLVNPDNVEEFTATIEDALVNIEWRQQAIANGLLVAARYNWDECVKSTVNVYKNLEF